MRLHSTMVREMYLYKAFFFFYFENILTSKTLHSLFSLVPIYTRSIKIDNLFVVERESLSSDFRDVHSTQHQNQRRRRGDSLERRLSILLFVSLAARYKESTL